MYNNGTISSSSRTSISYACGSYATNRHEFEQTAKPWSELSEQPGPSLESSMSPLLSGANKTRSLDQKAKTNDSQDRKNNDSLTPAITNETTTFYQATLSYIKDLFLLTQDS